MKTTFLRLLGVTFLSVFLLTACSKDDSKPNDDKGISDASITTTLKFSDGETVNFIYTQESGDLANYVYGPNKDNKYKLWLKGSYVKEGIEYTVNIHVNMPENAERSYELGEARLSDKDLVAEVLVARRELGSMGITYASSNIDHTSGGVTVTSLTENHIKGSFSGKAAWTDTDFVTIADGKFDIDIKRGAWEG